MSCSAVAPPGDVVAQPATVVGFDRRRQTAVEKLFRFLVGKGQLLAANLQQLIADAQVGNPQLRQVPRQDHQGHILRLMARKKRIASWITGLLIRW